MKLELSMQWKETRPILIGWHELHQRRVRENQTRNHSVTGGLSVKNSRREGSRENHCSHTGGGSWCVATAVIPVLWGLQQEGSHSRILIYIYIKSPLWVLHMCVYVSYICECIKIKVDLHIVWAALTNQWIQISNWTVRSEMEIDRQLKIQYIYKKCSQSLVI